MASDDGQATWTWDARDLWNADPTTFGDLDAPTRDLKTPLVQQGTFRDALFVHAPSGVWASYHDVGDGASSFSFFLTSLGGSVCYGADGGWPMSAGTLAVAGNLCTTDVFFNAMDQDGKTTCATHDDGWGPAWSASNNAGCPMDDVGHFGFGPNKLYPADESDASLQGFGQGFGGAMGLNTGTLGAGENALQMWLR